MPELRNSAGCSRSDSIISVRASVKLIAVAEDHSWHEVTKAPDNLFLIFAVRIFRAERSRSNACVATQALESEIRYVMTLPNPESARLFP
jgi:hypothetical protein